VSTTSAISSSPISGNAKGRKGKVPAAGGAEADKTDLGQESWTVRG
jgi:hypothetical protein